MSKRTAGRAAGISAVLAARQQHPDKNSREIGDLLGMQADLVRYYARLGGVPFGAGYGHQRPVLEVLRIYEQHAPDMATVAQATYGVRYVTPVTDWRVSANERHNLNIPGARQLRRWGYQGGPTMRLYMIEPWLRGELRRLGNLEAVADAYGYPIADLRAWVTQEQITPPPVAPLPAVPERGTEALLSLYPPPQARPDDWLDDVILGRVQVGGYTNAPVPWPYRRKTGKHSLILTERLAQAVRTEAARDIMEAWGVSETVVWGWRKALGVTTSNNPGTQRLYREVMPAKLTSERAAKGRAAASTPESRAKMRRTVIAGLPERDMQKIVWTEAMDALLGTMPDRQAAEALGVSPGTVATRRAQLQRPAYRARHIDIQWTVAMLERLGTETDQALAHEWGVNESSVKQKRLRLQIPPYSTNS